MAHFSTLRVDGARAEMQQEALRRIQILARDLEQLLGRRCVLAVVAVGGDMHEICNAGRDRSKRHAPSPAESTVSTETQTDGDYQDEEDSLGEIYDVEGIRVLPEDRDADGEDMVEGVQCPYRTEGV